MAISAEILEEYRCVSQRPAFTGRNYEGLLTWIARHARLAEPAPLGKSRARDPKDDIFIACALGAEADFIISSDKDLLVLEKPFGIEIVSPAQFLARHKL
jgi:putative PIN family toxin of toxin-antitoxin system